MARIKRRVRTSVQDTENGGRRNWSELPTEEWDRIISLYEARDSMGLAREAQQLGTSVSTLERQIRSAILVRDRYKAKFLANGIPESPSPLRYEFKVVHAEDAIIVSDIEVPDYSNFMFKAALLTGMRYGIKRIIFAGDLVATDQDALNTWLNTWRDEEGRTFMADVRELERIIATFKDWFTDGIDAILGNHDMRLAKKTAGQVTLDDLIKHTGVQLGQYSYMYVWNPTTKEWTYVCHQFNYSKTSVKLAQDVWTVVTAPDGYCPESVGPGIEPASAALMQGTVPSG